jgi:hypothetical protein
MSCASVTDNFWARHNPVKRLALQQAVAYCIEWMIVGIVIGLIGRPAQSSLPSALACE